MTDYLKMNCPKCGQPIEFPAEGLEQLISCPTCQEQIVARPLSIPATARTRTYPNPNLKTCNDCGQLISKHAEACPHCGAKTRKTTFLAWIGAVIGIFLLIGFLSSLVTTSNDSSKPHKLLHASISENAIELRVQNDDPFDWHATELYLNERPPFTFHYTLDTLKAGESVIIPLISFDKDGKRFQPTEYKVTQVWIGGGGFDYHSYTF